MGKLTVLILVILLILIAAGFVYSSFLFVGYLQHRRMALLLNPWLLGFLCSLALTLSVSHLLFRQEEIRNLELKRGYGVFFLLLALTFTYLPSIEPEHKIVLLVCIMFLNILGYRFAEAIAINSLIALGYSIYVVLFDPQVQWAFFWVPFALLHAEKFAFDLVFFEAKRQDRNLTQARWAATRFANLNIRMQNSAFFSEESIVVRERNRIAREIHDTVGHALTAVLYQMRSLKREYEARAENLPDLIGETEEIVKSALSDMRREVYSLKDTERFLFSWPVRWRKLCMIFADCTGVRIRVNIPENLGQIDDEIGESIFHIIQESLTNSIRHGKANYIDVTMLYEQDTKRLLLRISDNGAGTQKVKLGVGLTGIIERVKSLNGQIAWQTQPGRGFDLGIEVMI